MNTTFRIVAAPEIPDTFLYACRRLEKEILGFRFVKNYNQSIGELIWDSDIAKHNMTALDLALLELL